MSFVRRNLEVLGVRDAATKVSAFMPLHGGLGLDGLGQVQDGSAAWVMWPHRVGDPRPLNLGAEIVAVHRKPKLRRESFDRRAQF